MTVQSRPILVVVASVAFLLALAGMAFVAGLRVNLTPSYPLGLWRIEPLGRDIVVGDRVFICPPPGKVFELARERGYLRHGVCSGWFAPLIKTVVAVAGQRVVIDADIAVDGIRLPHSSVLAVDGEGRTLPPDTGGIVPAGQLFLFSDFTGSYDSRYFGPIPASGVLGLAHPLVVFDP